MKLNSENTLNFVRNISPAEGGGGSKDSDGDSVSSIDCDAVEAILENSSKIFEDFFTIFIL